MTICWEAIEQYFTVVLIERVHTCSHSYMCMTNNGKNKPDENIPVAITSELLEADRAGLSNGCTSPTLKQVNTA